MKYLMITSCLALLASLISSAAAATDPICSAPLCSGNGVLTQTASGYQCNCSGAFTGGLCNQPTCQNGGTYTSSGTCTCAGNFYGSNCEKSCLSTFKLLRDPNGVPVGCYYFVLAGKNWTDAGSYCTSLNSNAYLTVVSNTAQNTALKATFNQFTSTDLSKCNAQFYTSGRRATDNSCTNLQFVDNFLWKPANRAQIPIVNGTSFTDWSTGDSWNPNCQNGNENCLTFWSGVSWQWNDGGCWIASCSVCQVDL